MTNLQNNKEFRENLTTQCQVPFLILTTRITATKRRVVDSEKKIRSESSLYGVSQSDAAKNLTLELTG